MPHAGAEGRLKPGASRWLPCEALPVPSLLCTPSLLRARRRAALLTMGGCFSKPKPGEMEG